MPQKQAHDLAVDYDLQPGRDKSLTLTERYGTISAASAVYPNWYARKQAIGESDTVWMSDSVFTAAYMNAFVQGHMHSMSAPRLDSTAVIVLPWGEFWHTREIPVPQGRVIGQGTASGGVSQGSTVLSPYHEKWNGDKTKRNTFVSQRRGVSGYYGYMESTSVDGVRLEGRADYKQKDVKYDPSYESYGYLIAGSGENNLAGMNLGIRANNYNNRGVAWDGAAPGDCGSISVFGNKLGGFGVLGAALSTMSIRVLSGDENPYLLDVNAGNWDNPGGMLFIGAMKKEGGTTPEADLGHPYIGQMVAKLVGQFGVEIGVVNMATSHYRLHAAFHMHPLIGTADRQFAHLKVGSFRNVHNGKLPYDNIAIDTVWGKMWRNTDLYRPMSLEYFANNDAPPELFFGRKTTPETALTYGTNERLGFVAPSASFNETNWTPKFSFTGTVTPPAPTDPVPPTPTDPAPPVTLNPPTGTVIASFSFNSGTTGSIVAQIGAHMVQNVLASRASSMGGGKLANTNPTAFYDVNWKGVRTITLKAAKLRGTNNDRYLLGNGQAGGFRGIVIKASGDVMNNWSGVDVKIDTLSTTVAKDLVISFATPTEVTHFLAIPGAGNAAFVEADALEVKS